MKNPSQDASIAGRYFDGSSSNSVAATFSIVGSYQQLKFADGSATRQVEIDEVSDRLGSVPRKITFKDGGVFETPDNDAVDLLTGRHFSHGSILSRIESSWKWVIVSVFGAVFAIYLIMNYLLPVAADVAADHTPPVVLDVVNAGTLQTVDKLLFKESKLPQERQKQLSAIFDQLVAANGQNGPAVNLVFRDGGAIGPNAIALPGGTIILTDQLAQLASNDDELAGVLGHEIGHVDKRHSLRQIYRSLGLVAVVSMLGGDSGQFADQIVSQASLLQTLSYSRAYENESDAHSVELMTKLGRNPMAFVDLLDRVMDKYGDGKDGETSLSATHPGNKDRRANVEAKVKELKAQ